MALSYQFDNDQHLHFTVKDVGNALTDLNIEMDVNMGARFTHFDIIHFLGRNPTKDTCGRQGLPGLTR